MLNDFKDLYVFDDSVSEINTIASEIASQKAKNYNLPNFPTTLTSIQAQSNCLKDLIDIDLDFTESLCKDEFSKITLDHQLTEFSNSLDMVFDVWKPYIKDRHSLSFLEEVSCPSSISLFELNKFEIYHKIVNSSILFKNQQDFGIIKPVIWLAKINFAKLLDKYKIRMLHKPLIKACSCYVVVQAIKNNINLQDFISLTSFVNIINLEFINLQNMHIKLNLNFENNFYKCKEVFYENRLLIKNLPIIGNILFLVIDYYCGYINDPNLNFYINNKIGKIIIACQEYGYLKNVEFLGYPKSKTLIYLPNTLLEQPEYNYSIYPKFLKTVLTCVVAGLIIKTLTKYLHN